MNQPSLALVYYPVDGHLGPNPVTELGKGNAGQDLVVTWELGAVRMVPAAAADSLCQPQNGFHRAVPVSGLDSPPPAGATLAVYRPANGEPVDCLVLDLPTRRLLRAAAAAAAKSSADGQPNQSTTAADRPKRPASKTTNPGT